MTSFALSGFAQQAGSIRGTVYDKEFDAPLAAAEVSIAETGAKTTVSDEGNYIFNQVEPGSYTLVFSKQGYTRQVVADVAVLPGQMADVNTSLSGEFTEMDEFIVQDLQLGGNSEAGLLNLRMESPALLDSVSADLMSQAGASDAASALKLVAGTTVQEGKYAVVRGLPDRYVSSQMNSVRLPTADPDKRAVQLDQFPSALIESIQVSKTFTPDQQGDASGGAVNIVLKGIPDEPVLKVSVGMSHNTETTGRDDFLSYEGGGLNLWGNDDGKRDIPYETLAVTGSWDSAVGARHISAPSDYDWSVTAGGKREVAEGLRLGGLANFYYKRNASHTEDKIDDEYYIDFIGTEAQGLEEFQMTPQTRGDPTTITNASEGDGFYTKLFDVQQSSQEVQWGGLGALGIENDYHSLNALFMRTHSAEDKVTVAEDTRGKEYFVARHNPDYDPLALVPGTNPDGSRYTGDGYRFAAPYQRYQTLAYTERRTETVQISGQHTVPFPEVGIPHVFTVLEPEADWTVARSSSSLYQPDVREFGSAWIPGQEGAVTFDRRGNPRVYEETPSGYYMNKPAANYELGNLHRIWRTVTEESAQHFVNVKLPFEQWSGDKGYLKFGVFDDHVDRKYRQDSFSNFVLPGSGNSNTGPALPWDKYWTDIFPTEYHELEKTDTVDVDYDAEQDITAWYYMADLPVFSFFKLIGGVRRETTDLSIVLDPDPGVTWYPPTGNKSELKPGDGDVDFEETDDLPALGFEFQPIDQITLRGSYSETVARQTFKELTPIPESEYIGGDVFIGNPELEMSDVENYDLRLDLKPVEGSLISLSWFRKRIDKPIEYVQNSYDKQTYTGPVNYPSGELDGYELEVRQKLGVLWDVLDGLAIGGNGTLIHGRVTIPEDERALYIEKIGATSFAEGLDNFPPTERDMLNAPEYLYNLNLTYDLEKTGSSVGLFYTVKGDTLVKGPSVDGAYIPSVYAKEYGTLNFSFSQKIGDHLKLTFKAKNLLDPDIEEVYRSDYLPEDTTKTSYNKGIDFSLSLGGEF